jgi:branched-subunit amino acid ABC-type transport system permease component
MLTDLLIQVLSGVSRGMILFVVASGLTLIFGVLRIANFAHGSFYMIAAFVTYSVMRAIGSGNLGFIAAIVVAPIVVGALGAAIEILMLRQVVSDGIKMIWGGNNQSIERPPFLQGSIDILAHPFPIYSLLVIAVGLGIAAASTWLIGHTRFGRTISAAVVDPEMVGALGINVPRLYTMVFAIGAWLAGLGGVLAAPVGSVAIGIDNSIIIESFAVVMIGGAGSIPGALIGALLIGVLQAVGIMVAPRMAIAFIFIALCTVLMVRPQGLMGRRI